jgi:UDP:flavonoid glycosyltransferase YjiC (YdhE family)
VAVSSFDLGIDDPNVVLTRWVSMDRLLERSDVVVHHGGWGSTIAGLITGTPAIAVPLGADQFVNTARLASVGAARQVDVSGIEDQLGRALRSVLDEPVYRLNAERLAAEIAAMPAAAEVVPLVERLAEDGRPILNR